MGGAIVGLVLWVILVAVITLLYAPVLMARRGRRNGQTLGKQMLGIRVVRDRGEPMTFWLGGAARGGDQGPGRVRIASAVIPVVPWLLDDLWPLWDDENRALHDMAASTHVVRA